MSYIMRKGQCHVQGMCCHQYTSNVFGYIQAKNVLALKICFFEDCFFSLVLNRKGQMNASLSSPPLPFSIQQHSKTFHLSLSAVKRLCAGGIFTLSKGVCVKEHQLCDMFSDQLWLEQTAFSHPLCYVTNKNVWGSSFLSLIRH